ncbi:uncharacterized protein LOC114525403 [Dendronephthya gigantea]|uniref:uncharacterized protein LOC114525403 n=1 Tax=Dendronephthya gigantea TaxID=151771 RepID=UPI00106DA687|nr:uncharacterized protein LOC114525403 [Dendronephthya gigantea]
MALLERSQIGVKEFGSATFVQNDPRAKLMYYLSCVCSVLDLQQNVPYRLTQHATTYNHLTPDEMTELMALCILFSPDVLKDQVFFYDNSSFGSRNRFLELSAVKSSMLVAGDVIIGGQRRRVAKIMTCTREWLQYYYEQPMAMMLSRRMCAAPAYRPAIQAPPPQPTIYYTPPSRNNSGCCVIL